MAGVGLVDLQVLQGVKDGDQGCVIIALSDIFPHLLGADLRDYAVQAPQAVQAFFLLVFRHDITFPHIVILFHTYVSILVFL